MSSAALCRRDYRVRVAVRRPELAGYLQPSARSGRSTPCRPICAIRPRSRRRCVIPHVVINLVGILTEGGAQTFDAVQAKGAETVAKAAAAVGARLIHVSAIGADAEFALALCQGQGGRRSGGAGRGALGHHLPSLRDVRPRGPVHQPLCGAGADVAGAAADRRRTTRMQPVYVGDVATAIADAVDGKAKAGATYELGGPEVLTMREIIEAIFGHRRPQADAGPAVVRPRPLPGQLPAIRAGCVQADAGPGHAARARQCRVGCGEGRGADAGRPRHFRRFAGSDRPAISLALPPAGQFQRKSV